MISMKQKRTRIIIDGEVVVMPHFSGIGHYTLEMLRAIDKYLDSDSSVSVLLMVYFKDVNKARGFKFNNIKLLRSPFSQRISNGFKTFGIQPLLDIIFGRAIYIFPNYSSWPLLISKGISFIYDISYEKYPEFTEPRNRAFLSKQVKKSAERADIIATISNSSKSDIAHFYNINGNKIKVFYPAVDRAVYYRRSNKEIEAVKKKYAITGNYILFVGNIEPRKNLINLLLAYEQLPARTQKSNSIVIIGAKGWQDKEIFDVVTRLQNQGKSIQFPNKYVIDGDLPAFYSGAKLFVYPSIYEGFGIPPIEAMACGTPVLSANNSSLPEAVGNAALMTDALSISDISLNIDNLLTNKELGAKLVSEGYKQIEKFSWDNSAKKLIETIEEFSK